MTGQPETAPMATQPALSRSLAARHVAMISIGGIIGAGLFVGSSAAIAATGPAVLASYLLAGAVIYLVMRMLGEMAVARPDVHSFTEFARAGLGRSAGFIAGWLYWYFWIVVVPFEAIAGANILHQWFALDEWIIGLVLMAAMTAVNLLSARAYGEFEFWFASIKVAAIAGFVLLALAWLLGTGRPVAAHNLLGDGLAPNGVAAVLAAVVTVFFSLTGAEITTVAAAESVEPGRAIARLSTAVVVRILFFYVASILLIVCVVPWREVMPGYSPFAQALERMGHPWAGSAMSLVILTAVLSCLNSAFYVTSRVLFSLAAAGDAPNWLVKVNVRGVPTRSVWIGCLAGVAGILVAKGMPGRVFTFLLNSAGAVIVFVYLLIGAAQLRLRAQRSAAAQAALPAQMPWHPWLTLVAMLAMCIVLVAMGMMPSSRPELLASLVALGVAALAAWSSRPGPRR